MALIGRILTFQKWAENTLLQLFNGEERLLRWTRRLRLACFAASSGIGERKREIGSIDIFPTKVSDLVDKTPPWCASKMLSLGIFEIVTA